MEKNGTIKQIIRLFVLIATKKLQFCGKIIIMGANSSYTAMHNIVEQAKEGTIHYW